MAHSSFREIGCLMYRMSISANSSNIGGKTAVFGSTSTDLRGQRESALTKSTGTYRTMKQQNESRSDIP